MISKFNFSLLLILFTTVACNRSTSSDVSASASQETTVEAATDGTTTNQNIDPNTPGAEEKSVASIDCYDKTLAQPSMVCDDDRRPVCGCNGKTYKNACEAGKAGVIKYQWGPCTKSMKTAVK